MAKAKLYGGRWKQITGQTLGGGGQGDVLLVEDVSGELSGEYALKRVRNPLRRERFINEVKSISRLNDPNIVKLVDNSALDSDAAERQYLVMPVARGGDLGEAERIGLYRGSIDATVTVARQVASALAHAHKAGVIHRDVKPNNILFTGKGHDIWLTDFGICLIRGEDRNTPDGEAVGPRAFMAPELEGGGQLEVTEAVDIYSLGKLIYFMLSGGVVLPRERLHEEDYQRHMPQGARSHILGLLLGRMICPLGTRLKSMSEVLIELEKIATWEQRAAEQFALPETVSKMHSLQSQLRQQAQQRQQNTENETEERRRVDLVREGTLGLLTLDLTNASETHSNEFMELSVKSNVQMDMDAIRLNTKTQLVPIGNVGLCVNVDAPGRLSWLVFHLCAVDVAEIRVMVGGSRQSRGVEPRPVRDVPLCLVSTVVFTGNPHYLFLTHPDKVGSQMFGVPPVGQHASIRRGPQSMQVVGDAEPICHESVALLQRFKTSDWPKNSDDIRKYGATALDCYMGMMLRVYGTD
jgi:serine/threonine protein kinase